MHKWTLILATALLSFHQAFAGTPAPSKNVITVAQASCVSCLKSGSSSNDALADFIKNMEDITDGAVQIEAVVDKMGYADKCENFAGNGEVKKWGTIIGEELDSNKYSSLYAGSKDIKRYCPNYATMSPGKRKGVWILVMTAMTHYESSCEPTEKAKGPNGIAKGLLQLHDGKEGLYSAGCRKGDSKSAERSLICGLSMLNDQIERGEPLFSPSSYWEVLRPAGRSKKAKKIQSAINHYEPCTQTETRIGAQQNSKVRVAFK